MASDEEFDPGIVRGWHLVEINRFDDAAAAAQEVLVREPTSVDALLLLAHAFGRLERPADALNAARSAVRLAPENPDVLLLLAQALSDVARNDTTLLPEAVAATDSLLAIAPTSPLVHDVAARVHAQRRGGKALAKEHAERAIELEPASAAPYLLAAQVAATFGESFAAHKHLESALAIEPANASALRLMAIVSMNGGNQGNPFGTVGTAARLQGAAAAEDPRSPRNRVVLSYVFANAIGTLLGIFFLQLLFLMHLLSKGFPWGWRVALVAACVLTIGILVARWRPSFPANARLWVPDLMRSSRGSMTVMLCSIPLLIATQVVALIPALGAEHTSLIAGLGIGGIFLLAIGISWFSIRLRGRRT